MKREDKTGFITLLIICTIMLLSSLLVACSTTGGASAATPAQIAGAVCPVVQADLATYQSIFAAQTDVASSAKISADLAKAEPIVAALCANGATVSTASVQAFAQTALPALADTVNYLPLTPAQKAKVVQDLTIAELAVGVAGVVEAQVQAAPAAAK